MNSSTLKSLNSQWTKLFEDEDGVVRVGIELDAVLKGKVSIQINEVEEEHALELVKPTPPAVVITENLASIYDPSARKTLEEDVVEYLQVVAKLWTSQNRTASAVTGSLIGKVSKSHTQLNEKVYRLVGGDRRDAVLKELIKCNMPTLEYIWAENQ